MSKPSLPLPRAFAAALATIVLWAGAFSAISVGVRHVDPIGLAAVRFAVAGAVMGLWLAWRGSTVGSRADVLRIAVCGALGIALYNVLLNTGQRSVSAGAASFIIATQPIFAAAFACLSGAELPRPAMVVGTALGLLGVAAISLGQGGGFHLGVGAPMILAAAACSGGYFVIQRPLVLRYGAATSASWTIAVGALLLLPWLPSGIAQTAHSVEAIAAVAFLALGAGVLGYICWMEALAGLGAARAANLLFLMAPLATLLAIPITGVVPAPATILGGAVALAGVAIVNHSYRRAPEDCRRQNAEPRSPSSRT
jgi:drug/metabolite transporter (DMT)-like permease